MLHSEFPLTSVALCSVRGALPKQDILQPDHSGTARLEDLWRDEEHGRAEVRPDAHRVPSAQSDPGAGQLLACLLVSARLKNCQSVSNYVWLLSTWISSCVYCYFCFILYFILFYFQTRSSRGRKHFNSVFNGLQRPGRWIFSSNM